MISPHSYIQLFDRIQLKFLLNVPLSELFSVAAAIMFPCLSIYTLKRPAVIELSSFGRIRGK